MALPQLTGKKKQEEKKHHFDLATMNLHNILSFCTEKEFLILFNYCFLFPFSLKNYTPGYRPATVSLLIHMDTTVKRAPFSDCVQGAAGAADSRCSSVGDWAHGSVPSLRANSL